MARQIFAGTIFVLNGQPTSVHTYIGIHIIIIVIHAHMINLCDNWLVGFDEVLVTGDMPIG